MSLESVDKSDLLELIVWYFFGESEALEFSGGGGGGGGVSQPLVHKDIKLNSSLKLDDYSADWLYYAHGPKVDYASSWLKQQCISNQIANIIISETPDIVNKIQKCIDGDNLRCWVELNYIVSRVVEGRRSGAKLISTYALADLYKIDKNYFKDGRPLGKVYYGATSIIDAIENDIIQSVSETGLFDYIQRKSA